MKLRYEGEISSAHKLPKYTGPCKETHGHNWRVVVELHGGLIKKGPCVNMIMDGRKIKQVLKLFDHTDLNKICDDPTSEMIAAIIGRAILENAHGEIERVKVTVWETPKMSTEWDSRNDMHVLERVASNKWMMDELNP